MSRKRQSVASKIGDLRASLTAAERLRSLTARDPDKNKPWYRISASSSGLDTEVLIYAEIGEWGVTALDFVQEIRGISTPNITLRINSPGGQIFDGFSIYNAVLSHPAHVVARIEGVAASAASFIAQAADEIEAYEASTMMVHGGSGLCYGKAADMREMADLLDKLDGQMAAIYAQRTERPAAEWAAQMATDTWYTAAEAVAAGIADRVVDPRPDRADEPAHARTDAAPTAAGTADPTASTTQSPAATSEPAVVPSTEDDDDPFLRVFQEV